MNRSVPPSRRSRSIFFHRETLRATAATANRPLGTSGPQADRLEREHPGGETCMPARRQRSTPTPDTGYLLLEIAVLLVVTVPLVLALAHAIGVAAALRSETAQFARGVTAYLRTQASVGRAIAHLEGHRFPFGLTVHPPGRLHWTSGVPHPLSGHVALDSTPLSALDLILPATATITDRAPTGELRATSVWGESIPTETRLFLGIGGEHVALLSGSARRTGHTPLRYELTVHVVPSVTVPASPLDLAAVRLCIPVRREYSLFVDRAGQLRYISHAGAATLENQPLLRGLKRLTFTETPAKPTLPAGYHATIVTRDKRVRSASFVPTVGRRPLHTFVLVRP